MALPRVLVFDAGTLIDDTHRKLSQESQSALRAQAFASAPEEVAEGQDEEQTATAAETETEMVERLRGIVSEWDQRQTEHAKAILEEAGGE